MAYLYYTLASLSRQCNMTASRSRYRSRAPGFFNKGPHDFELDQNSEQVRDPWSREVEYETPGTPMDLMGRAGLVNFAPSLHTLSTIIILITHCSKSAHFGKNISVTFSMTIWKLADCWPDMELRGARTTLWACWLWTCNQCYLASFPVGNLREQKSKSYPIVLSK